MKLCGQCEHQLTPAEFVFVEKALQTSDLADYTMETLAVICGTCSVLERDPYAPHKGGEREHIHLFPPSDTN